MSQGSASSTQRTLKRAVYLALGLQAAVSLIGAVLNAQGHSQDMQWSPLAVFWRSGLDPYQAFLHPPRPGLFILTQAPNNLHLTFFVLAPLAWLSFPAAKAAWAAANLAFLAGIVRLLRRAPTPAPWPVLLLFLGSTPVAIAIGNGQLSIFCLLFYVAAIRLQAERPGWAALAASIGAIKFSLGAPMALAMRMRPRTLAAFALLPGLALIYWSLRFHLNPIQALLEPVRVASQDIGDRDGVGDLRMLLLTLGGVSPMMANRMALAALVVAGLVQRRLAPRADPLELCAFYGALSLALVLAIALVLTGWDMRRRALAAGDAHGPVAGWSLAGLVVDK